MRAKGYPKIELQDVRRQPNGVCMMLVVPAPGWPVWVRIPARLYLELCKKLGKKP